MCYYRYTMLHDIRPAGTVNLRETINPAYSLLSLQYSSHPEFEGPRHHILSLHTYLEQPLEMNELYIFIISERRRGYRNTRAHSMVFIEYEEGCGLGHQHQIALVNLILAHFTQASRAFWVGRSDSCHILGISASEVGPLPLATAGPWPCCASGILLFSEKCANAARTVLWGAGAGGFTCTEANQ